MKREDFFEVLGELEDGLVEGARRQGRRKAKRKAWGAMAACFVLAAFLGIHGIHTMAPAQDSTASNDNGMKQELRQDPFPDRKGDGEDASGEDFFAPGGRAFPDGAVKKEMRQDILRDLKSDRNSWSNKYYAFSEAASPGEDVLDLTEGRDAPVTNDPGSTGALTSLDEIWGGSYMDQSGRWVVWLTENTPENQVRVFERNPSLREDNTVFKTADFSLAYLTELLADISGEMGAKRLPFVTTAALREQDNRVEVTMTTEDESCAARVLGLDTLGGAIVFRYAAGGIADRAVEKGPASDGDEGSAFDPSDAPSVEME